MSDLSAATSADQFMQEALKEAAAKFPDHGFLVYMIDDADMSLTMLTNMDQDEVKEVHAVADQGSEVPFSPFDAIGTRH